MDDVLRNTVKGKNRGITWKLTDTLEDLDYADDICLIAHKHSDMQNKLTDLQQESVKVGLKINLHKTKEFRVNFNIQGSLRFDDNDVERVETFTCLGSNIAVDGGAIKDVHMRIQMARGAFSRLRKIWLCNSMHLNTKIKISVALWMRDVASYCRY